MSDGTRKQFSVRLNQADKTYFIEVAEAAGIDASCAARQLIELFVNHLRRNPGADYVSALATLNVALGSPARSKAA